MRLSRNYYTAHLILSRQPGPRLTRLRNRLKSVQMDCNDNGQGQGNQFALVSYIAPEPLGSFLDHLRLILAPDCRPHAHVTVLPPRYLSGTVGKAEAELREAVASFHAFEVELGDVELFAATDVVYIEVTSGYRELRELHDTLNRGAVQFDEQYSFHPHITLAQNMPKEVVAARLTASREAWKAWTGPRKFWVDQLTFVENFMDLWKDLACLPLVHEPAELVR